MPISFWAQILHILPQTLTNDHFMMYTLATMVLALITLMARRSDRPYVYVAKFIFILTAFAPSAYCASVKVSWDAVTKNEDGSGANLGGYEVYYGTTSNNYSTTVDAGMNIQTTVSGLSAGQTYFFSVKAFSAQGVRSKFAIEKSITLPAGPTGEDPIATPTPLPPTTPGSSAPHGDFDGDGITDIVIANRSVSTTAYTLTLSTGSAQTISFGPSKSYDASGDYDGDGFVDIGSVQVVGKKYVWTAHSVHLGVDLASEEFGSKGESLLTGCNFDSDAITDKATLKNKVVHILNSSTHKSRSVRLPFTAVASSAYCADINGDGVDEIIANGIFKGDKYLAAVSAAGKTTIFRKVGLRGVAFGGDLALDGSSSAAQLFISKKRNGSAAYYASSKGKAEKTLAFPAASEVAAGTFLDGTYYAGLLLTRAADSHLILINIGTGVSVDLVTLGRDDSLVPAVSFVTPGAKATARKKARKSKK